jgi:hypothetical protein
MLRPNRFAATAQTKPATPPLRTKARRRPVPGEAGSVASGAVHAID